MKQLEVYTFLETNKDFLFPNKEFTDADVQQALLSLPDDFNITGFVSFRNPKTVQMIAVFPGSLGVDRFYLGDITNGILKYFTLGGFGIWWIKDIFSAKDRCRAYNCRKLIAAIQDLSAGVMPKGTDDTQNKASQAANAAASIMNAAKDGIKSIRNTFDVK